MADFNSLVNDFKALGIKPGMSLLTHSSLRRVGPVEGELTPLSTHFSRSSAPKVLS